MGKETRLVMVDDVAYFRADDKYTVVVTPEGEALILALDTFHRRISETCEECGSRTGYRRKTQLGRGGDGRVLSQECGQNGRTNFTNDDPANGHCEPDRRGR